MILEQYQLDTFTTLTVLVQIYLPWDIHHPGTGSRFNFLRIFRIAFVPMIVKNLVWTYLPGAIL